MVLSIQEFVYKGQEIMSNKEDVTNINGDISNATMSHTSNDISNTDFIIRDLDLNQEPEMPRESKNFWQDAWSQLKRNKLAVIGMIGLLLIVIMAFIGPLMNKHDFAEQNVDHCNLPAKIPLLDHVSFLPFDGKGTDGKMLTKQVRKKTIGLVLINLDVIYGHVLGKVLKFHFILV